MKGKLKWLVVVMAVVVGAVLGGCTVRARDVVLVMPEGAQDGAALGAASAVLSGFVSNSSRPRSSEASPAPASPEK